MAHRKILTVVRGRIGCRTRDLDLVGGQRVRERRVHGAGARRAPLVPREEAPAPDRTTNGVQVGTFNGSRWYGGSSTPPRRTGGQPWSNAHIANVSNVQLLKDRGGQQGSDVTAHSARHPFVSVHHLVRGTPSLVCTTWCMTPLR